VGLIPKRAIEQAAEWFLQLENFDSSLIFENRLAAIVSGKVAVGGLRSGIEPFIEQTGRAHSNSGRRQCCRCKRRHGSRSGFDGCIHVPRQESLCAI